jgi:hypothetical protein
MIIFISPYLEAEKIVGCWLAQTITGSKTH